MQGATDVAAATAGGGRPFLDSNQEFHPPAGAAAMSMAPTSPIRTPVGCCYCRVLL